MTFYILSPRKQNAPYVVPRLDTFGEGVMMWGLTEEGQLRRSGGWSFTHPALYKHTDGLSTYNPQLCGYSSRSNSNCLIPQTMDRRSLLISKISHTNLTIYWIGSNTFGPLTMTISAHYDSSRANNIFISCVDDNLNA